MGHMTKSVVEPLHTAAFGLPVGRSRGVDSRTLRKQYLVDVVLPAFALVFMSAMTVTMIVLVVTTVAHGGWLQPPTYVSVDPWLSISPGPAVLREDDIMYPEIGTRQGADQSEPSLDPQARDGAGTGYFAAGVQE